MSKVGDLIKEWRIKKRLTQRGAAMKLFVDKETISHWELGKTDPSYPMLRVIHDVIKCDWEEMF